MDELITLGEVIKPQGIRGEVKIRPFTDDVARFSKLRAVFLDTVPYKIASLRTDKGFVFIKFLGIDNRDEAEKLRGRLVKIDRVHAINLDEGAYFVADLLGCEFFIDGEDAGKISNIYQNGAADVFEVKLKNGKTLLFPHLKALGLEIDVEKGRIDCQNARLIEVAVYED